MPNINDLQFQTAAKKFFDCLINGIDRKASEITSPDHLPTKFRLVEASQRIRRFEPSTVYLHFIKCINSEQQLLKSAETATATNEYSSLTQSLRQLKNHVHETKSLQIAWIRKIESVICDHNEANHFDEDLEEMTEDERSQRTIDRQLQITSVEHQLSQLAAERPHFASRFQYAIDWAKASTSKVIDEYLGQWKWQHRLKDQIILNGVQLDDIQVWCEILADCLWNTREQISGIIQRHKQALPAFQELHNAVTEVLLKLIRGSFIIEQQPPQVIKTQAKVPGSSLIRLLIGNALGIKTTETSVTVSIVSEAQVQQIARTGNFSGSSHGNLVNKTATLDFSETTSHVVANFCNLKLCSFKRPDKSSDNVTDQKFAMLYEAKICIGNLEIEVKVLSMPIVIVCHGSQEPQAWSTIFWDNYFAKTPRDAFQVPEKVPWNEFSNALNHFFMSLTHRGLTEENIHFLAEKIFHRPMPNNNFENCEVSWKAFCKDELPGRDFSFWLWFYAALKLTRDHVREPWVDGSVQGFIGLHRIESLLFGSSNGTFMLRFSESELGEKN